MTKMRSILFLGVAGILVLVAVAWLFLLSPRMDVVSELKAQTLTVEESSETTRTKIAELKQKEADLPATREQAAAVAAKFPSTAAESELLTMLQQAAVEAGLPVTAISDLTAGVPALGTAAGAVTVPEDQAAEDDAAAQADTQGGQADPNAPTDAAAQVKLASMTLDVTVSGNRDQVTRFLAALEGMDRAYLVNTVTIAEAEGRGVSVAINGTMYLLPELIDPEAPPVTEDAAGSPEAPSEGAPSMEVTPAP